MNSLPAPLEPLAVVDEIRRIERASPPTFIHNDHRFFLPVLHWAQEERLLPRPCRLVMLDQHHDALDTRKPGAAAKLRALRQQGFTMELLLDFVQNYLAEEDDDWVRSGMELGLLSDAIIFGAQDGLGSNPKVFDDHLGTGHRIWINRSLPGECFGRQGNLGDLGRGHTVQPLWDLLSWDPRPKSFGFVDPFGPYVWFPLDRVGLSSNSMTRRKHVEYRPLASPEEAVPGGLLLNRRGLAVDRRESVRIPLSERLVL